MRTTRSALRFEVCLFHDIFGMPRKIRQLIADLEKHGLSIAEARDRIETSSTPRA
jgi:hypothetical protein